MEDLNEFGIAEERISEMKEQASLVIIQNGVRKIK